MKNNKNKTTQKKGGMSMARAGATGVVIGGALGAGAAIAFADANRRKAVGNKIGELKTFASDTFRELHKASQDVSIKKRLSRTSKRKN